MTRKEEYQDERWKARAAEIRELDHHQCAMCGAKDVELHVHHLSYPPQPFHIWDSADSELVTLCKECHTKIHESAERPTLSVDRSLAVIQYRKDEYSGDRMVLQSLYGELCKRGYKGKPYTQQIIDWMREERWVFISLSVLEVYEYEGRERACGFRVIAKIHEIRTSCLTFIREFNKYEEAEIAAIKYAVDYGYI